MCQHNSVYFAVVQAISLTPRTGSLHLLHLMNNENGRGLARFLYHYTRLLGAVQSKNNHDDDDDDDDNNNANGNKKI